MAKRMKFDESGDSDDLQALFDSIAEGGDVTSVSAVTASVTTENPGPKNESGDSDDLQNLFDEVAAEFEQAHAEPAVTAEPSLAAVSVGSESEQALFTRIGQITRQLHNTLRELGLDSAVQELAEAIPDARQRLTYIAQMTEQAASRVLNATDIAKPIQDRFQTEAAQLSQRWALLYGRQLSVDEFKVLAGQTRDFIDSVGRGSEQTNAQLLEIMMAQDFQDLTGQVIKRVVDMAQQLESQLLQVLIEVAPAEKRCDKHSELMNGPVINSEGRDDVVTTQAQVDDLLESLGF